MAKTNIGLVDYARKAIGLPYWLGGFGQVGSYELFKQYARMYPNTYNSQTKESYEKQYGKIVHDCCGLIKGYMWKDTFTSPYKYESNGLPDIDQAEMYRRCQEKGAIGTMPDIPGILVFKGPASATVHVGVYIGGGEVIEAKGHAYGVVKSRVADGWTLWGKFPYIEYETVDNEKEAVTLWQTAAVADGFRFPKYGIDGEWGDECNSVAKAALVQQWKDGIARYPTLTKLAQTWLCMKPEECDGICGKVTTAHIKAFQRNNGLTPDGGIGLLSWKKLIELNS